MATYNYQLAKQVLSEADKDRIVCIYLHSETGTAPVDWAAATTSYGSASIESFKKTTANMLKKLDAATKKAAEDGNLPSVPATPASGTKGGRPKKRKGSEDGGDGEEVVTPKPAKRARAAKKTKAVVAKEDEEGDEGPVGEVKVESAEVEDTFF